MTTLAITAAGPALVVATVRTEQHHGSILIGFHRNTK